MGTDFLVRPKATEHPPGFGRYIALAPEKDVVRFLEKQRGAFRELLEGMSETDALAVHAPYAWTIKQVVGHVTDAERIFGYRCLRIARNDATPLPSFDENAYVRHAEFDRWPMGELVSEFELVRRSHILLFEHMGAEAWMRVGVVGGHRTTARALPYVIAGHAQHHLEILRRRLGQ